VSSLSRFERPKLADGYKILRSCEIIIGQGGYNINIIIRKIKDSRFTLCSALRINLMRNPLSGRNPRVSGLVIRNPVNK
jgi:hypothetical protein